MEKSALARPISTLRMMSMKRGKPRAMDWSWARLAASRSGSGRSLGLLQLLRTEVRKDEDEILIASLRNDASGELSVGSLCWMKCCRAWPTPK